MFTKSFGNWISQCTPSGVDILPTHNLLAIGSGGHACDLFEASGKIVFAAKSQFICDLFKWDLGMLQTLAGLLDNQSGVVVGWRHARESFEFLAVGLLGDGKVFCELDLLR